MSRTAKRSGRYTRRANGSGTPPGARAASTRNTRFSEPERKRTRVPCSAYGRSAAAARAACAAAREGGAARASAAGTDGMGGGAEFTNFPCAATGGPLPCEPKLRHGRCQMDPVAFAKLKRIMPAFLAHRREGTPHTRDLPEEVALKLTNRCNLRCRHCYQWNEEGHHRDLPKAEQLRDMDIEVVREVFAATRE